MSENIQIIGAKTHNLKNISLSIPKNTLTVVTGVSGSGKSSLAFDTLYAEGQKRYLESLSTYARMIIGDVSSSTEVEEIRGLSPTIAIHQKTVSNNPRSTVGTITEIYDYYRLLFANLGTPHCPNHPNIALVKNTLEQISNEIIQEKDGTKLYILFPLEADEDGYADIVKRVSDLGFVRFMIDEVLYSVADAPDEIVVWEDQIVYVVVDRLVRRDDEAFLSRLKDGLRLTAEKGNGKISIYFPDTHTKKEYSLHSSCSRCGYSLPELSLSHFSFNSHHGACEDCLGLGHRTTFLEADVVNESLSVAEWALLPWQGHMYRMSVIEAVAKKKNIFLDTPYKNLSKKHKDILLYGTDGRYEAEFVRGNETSKHSVRYEGLIPFLERQYSEITSKSDTTIKHLAKFATEQTCRSCEGYRLKKPFLNVKIWGKNIGEVSAMSVEVSRKFFDTLLFSQEHTQIAAPILKNISERLEFLSGVGLDYITLHRRANTLSGGESQRIRLATQIGTRLEGIIYVLDEPSIGLHPRDNDMLITNLKRLAEIGNTVIVVEHDEDIMRESDYIIDIGPRAGVHGGECIFSGTYQELITQKNTETGMYLSGAKTIERRNPKKPSTKEFLAIYGARENNLKNINVRIPLSCMTVVTGVSGSGKSSLIIDILSNSLHNHFHKSLLPVGEHDRVEGMSNIDKVIIIDQSPIGRTPHSNIATYTGVFTYIREVFAASNDAKKRGFGVGRFSFNTKGGRCETCEGSGTRKVEMHFLPDMYVECEACEGSRYNKETLSIQFKGKNIAEVLAMTIEESLEFFKAFPRITRILSVLDEVGLRYITLGQSAPTLSGGESQRIKLAFDLAKRSTGKTLYILDEPTTGLHFSDVQKLLDILDRLVEKGNSVLIIEHNLDIIANADAIIDIGPEWGDKGGELVFAGPRDKILDVSTSHTGRALKKYWKERKR